MTKNKCPECGGTTGYQFVQLARFARKWGQSKKKLLFFTTTPREKRCLDCNAEIPVKKPDTTVKKPDSLKSGE